MRRQKNRFDDAWNDAIAAEAALLEERQVERSYRRVLALTDDVLGKLEQRNLRGERVLDDEVRRDLAGALSELPPDARSRFPRAGSVQEALDGIFLVQETILLVLQRMLHWDRLVA
ncbi:MAG TPA: hypothetical protein VE953_01620 [Terriglobales bacterium]|nr:hypothetical protein [Candidatus Dormibacteraeota bacterium]HYW22829.1 hypothetical protein [Terriglobales bacterium]